MIDDNIDNISQWVHEYWIGYCKYMNKYHKELFNKFDTNIHPPQRIGGCVGIMQGKIHTNNDYAEIMNISKEFCQKYPNPINFPKDF